MFIESCVYGMSGVYRMSSVDMEVKCVDRSYKQ